jgi:phage-related protein
MPTLPPVLLELQAKAGEALAALGEMEHHAEKLGTESSAHMQRFQAVGKAALLGVAGAATVVGGYALEMADKFEQANARLETSVVNAGGSFDQLKPHLDATISQLAKFGYTSTDTESALADLTAATHHPAESLQQMSLAADVARGRNISLADATHLLVYAQTGHVAMLSRLGIQVKDNNGKLVDAKTALERLSQMYGGAASRNAETFAGKTQALKAQAANLATQLGMVLVPILEHVAAATEAVVNWFEQHRTTAEALGIVVGTVLVAAIGAYVAGVVTAAVTSAAQFATMIAKGAAWVAEQVAQFATTAAAAVASAASTAAAWVAANATMLLAGGGIVLALAALGVAAYELATHWSTVWNGVKAVALAVWDVLKTAFDAIVNVGLAPIRLYIAGLEAEWRLAWDAVKTVTTAVWAALKTVFDAVVNTGLRFIRTEVQGLESVWRAVWSGVQAAVETVWSGLKPVFDAVVHAGLWLVRNEIRGLQTVWSTVWNGIQTVVQNVWAVLKPIFDAIKSAIHDVTSGIGDVAGVAGKIGGGIGSILGHFASGTSYAPGGLAEVGERGPELMYVPRGAQILNAGSTSRLLSGETGGAASTRVVQQTIAPQVSVTVEGNLDNVTLDQVQQVASAAATNAAVAAASQLTTELTAGRS